ncbi:hypothetical protein AOL_s00054g641 [Orbilia oligospora ATCC 24927]|uniref:Mid2 domain-containing protein n=2 Tax=Orbilia oligospora TaxID=2813651 RepID=G1X6Z7_ARTOA|nr:hypothetical protein AOL_s00054g641 [Orbilia oligospora ATCC 24927]EGX51081.1 hypothetical protein AOL_s00054g641 [Orbilia oligospora ATCC 24927]KAF3273373.1 hypothetical protein TWF970_009155 [Orbilia oligospora]
MLYHLCFRIILDFIFFSSVVFSRVTISKDGPGRLLGFEGLAYQAIRYEPLCGNLGRAYPNSIDTGFDASCRPAIEYFVNTTDSLAFYDITGQELTGVRVGGGRDLCMCFAMKDSARSTFAGALCVWVYGNDGQAEDAGGSIVGSYRPAVALDKALPVCGGSFDLEAARETWSRTAVQASAVEPETRAASTVNVVNSIGEGSISTKEITKIDIRTVMNTSDVNKDLTPSCFEYTLVVSSISTVIYTTTGTNGVPITVTSVTTIESAVSPEFSDPKGQKNRGLDSGAKLSLGLGLGIGLPGVALLSLVVYRRVAVARRKERGLSKVEPGSLGTGIINGSTTGGTSGT